MSIFRRAWLYITRKRVRTFLLFAVVFMAAAVAMLGLAVKTSADKEASDLRKSLGSSFIFELNPAGITQLIDSYKGELVPYEKRPNVTVKLLERILEFDHVTDYFAYAEQPGVWVNLTLREGIYTSWYKYGLEDPEFLKKLNDQSLDRLFVRKQLTNLYCCNRSNLYQFFVNGAYSLSQGRHIRNNDTNKAVISAPLAGRNGLSVGDTFNAEIREGVFKLDGDLYKVDGKPIPLEIVGIYDINFEQEPSYTIYESGEKIYNSLESTYAESMIFCDMNTAYQIFDIHQARNNRTGNSLPLDSTTIFIDDPDNVAAVRAQVDSLDGIDHKFFLTKPDDTEYSAAVRPLNQLSTASALLIAAILTGCAVLTGLLMNMWIKSRRREIAILMSAGVRGRGILLQLLLESLAIVLAALLLAVLVSSLLAAAVGGLAEKAVSPQTADTSYTYDLDMYLNPVVQKISANPVNLNYGLTASNILIVAAVLLGCSSLGVVITARQILRLNPKQVLTRH